MASFFDKIKTSKAVLYLAVGLIAGILFIILGSSESKSENIVCTSESEELSDASNIISSLEVRVTELISHMDGISDVHVIITPESTTESVYLSDGKWQNGSLTEREYVIRDSGNGNPVRVKLTFPKLRGVAVVCRGGSNPINSEKIVMLLCSLFDIPSNRVYVTG